MSSPVSTWFMERNGTYRFENPEDGGGRGYLPQLHEWAQSVRKELKWQSGRAGGKEHMPLWESTPVCKHH
jgi:hypothetical protein